MGGKLLFFVIGYNKKKLKGRRVRYRKGKQKYLNLPWNTRGHEHNRGAKIIIMQLQSKCFLNYL